MQAYLGAVTSQEAALGSVIMWYTGILIERGELLEMHTGILCFMLIQKVL